MPYPFSVTVSTSCPFWGVQAPITLSPCSRRMPITPRAVRPIGRTFCSLKQTAKPLRVPIRISDPPVVSMTDTSLSSSSSPCARMPFLRMLASSGSLSLFTMPFSVTVVR